MTVNGHHERTPRGNRSDAKRPTLLLKARRGAELQSYGKDYQR